MKLTLRAPAKAPPPAGPTDTALYLRRLALAAAVVIAIALVIKLADVLLLVFGAVLAAITLHAIAGPVRRFTPLGDRASLAVAALASVAVVGLTSWAFGRQLDTQLASLADLLPKAWTAFRAQISQYTLGRLLLVELDHLPTPGGGWLSLAPRYAATAAGAIGAAVVVLFAGLYLAISPRPYAQGFVRLFPLSARPRAEMVLSAIHVSLRRWLLGQLISMLLVGGAVALGLWLVGAPSPVGLGLLAGIGQFVPIVGPIVATAPGLMVALTDGPQTVLLAGAVYVGASQLEANVITPLVMRRMVELPMAMTLFAVLAMGVLLGPLGVIFGTPLAVVIYVVVKMVWVQDVLGEVPADPEEDPAITR